MLNDKQQRFVEEYLIDLNATESAKRAGYSERTAYSIGQRLLTHPKVAEAIAVAKSKRSERAEISADDVLDKIRKVAFADPREIVELRRNCCRYCWGEGYKYQRTESEMERDRAKHAKKQEDSPDKAIPPFQEQGGTGYHKRKKPNPDCPECFGDGVEEMFAHDTRTLSDYAQAAFAGVKQTREGIEIKIHDPMDALAQLGKHLGLFVDKKLVQMNGSMDLLHREEPAYDLTQLDEEELKMLDRIQSKALKGADPS